MTQSKKYTLNKEDWIKAGKSAAFFFIPVALIYLGQIQGALSTDGHVVSLKDLIPTTFTWGSVVTYVIMQLQGLYRRFSDGKMVK